ncbi:hypothetical protein, partial [Altererythrobacter lauratis]
GLLLQRRHSESIHALNFKRLIGFRPQEWYWERELAAGSSEEDIREYPTVELIRAMHEWKDAGEPV